MFCDIVVRTHLGYKGVIGEFPCRIIGCLLSPKLLVEVGVEWLTYWVVIVLRLKVKSCPKGENLPDIIATVGVEIVHLPFRLIACIVSPQ